MQSGSRSSREFEKGLRSHLEVTKYSSLSQVFKEETLVWFIQIARTPISMLLQVMNQGPFTFLMCKINLLIQIQVLQNITYAKDQFSGLKAERETKKE